MKRKTLAQARLEYRASIAEQRARAEAVMCRAGQIMRKPVRTSFDRVYPEMPPALKLSA